MTRDLLYALTLILLLVPAVPLRAQPVPGACESLRAARALAPLAGGEEGADRLTARLVADALHTLRGPLPGGAYRWARLSEKAAVPVPRNVKVDRGRLEWKIEGADWFALRLECPEKKNLFWGNAPVMVRSVTVDDGTGSPRVLLQDRRLSRGEEVKLPFGAILPKAAVVILFEKLPDSERDPFVEVEALQAGLWDDPANPAAELVKLVRDLADERPGGEWYLSRLDRAIEGCGKPVRRELEYILYLLDGSPAEQAEGRRRLKDLVEHL
jgi:hypothetical protein